MAEASTRTIVSQRYRIVVEIEMSEDSTSADDAIEWMLATLEIIKPKHGPEHPYRPRVVSATPVPERKR